MLLKIAAVAAGLFFLLWLAYTIFRAVRFSAKIAPLLKTGDASMAARDFISAKRIYAEARRIDFHQEVIVRQGLADAALGEEPQAILQTLAQSAKPESFKLLDTLAREFVMDIADDVRLGYLSSVVEHDLTDNPCVHGVSISLEFQKTAAWADVWGTVPHYNRHWPGHQDDDRATVTVKSMVDRNPHGGLITISVVASALPPTHVNPGPIPEVSEMRFSMARDARGSIRKITDLATFQGDSIADFKEDLTALLKRIRHVLDQTDMLSQVSAVNMSIDKPVLVHWFSQSRRDPRQFEVSFQPGAIRATWPVQVDFVPIAEMSELPNEYLGGLWDKQVDDFALKCQF